MFSGFSSFSIVSASSCEILAISRLKRMVFRKAHRLRRVPLLAVAHVAVGPVRPGELDHQRELVDAADGGKHGDELVLEVVPRDPVAVDLGAAAAPVQPGGGPRRCAGPASAGSRSRWCSAGPAGAWRGVVGLVAAQAAPGQLVLVDEGRRRRRPGGKHAFRDGSFSETDNAARFTLTLANFRQATNEIVANSRNKIGNPGTKTFSTSCRLRP